MTERWKHPRKYAPLSKAALESEREQLRALRLEDVEWDPKVGCPWCSQGRPHPWETESSRGKGYGTIVRLCMEVVFVIVMLSGEIMDVLHRL